jgi:hypothetical protein
LVVRSLVARSLLGFAALGLVSGTAQVKSDNPFKFYKNQEEYCRDKPQMPTCIKTGPVKLDAINGGLYKAPKTAPAAPRTISPSTRSITPSMQSPTAVTLQDWRFSHISPAMLISINLGSLLKSPVWPALLSAWGVNVKPADMDKIRAGLSDVGQLLISVSPNGTATPGVLVLAKGNMDGPFGQWLRTGDGMQSKRLDAITVLMGDARSLEMASHRLRSTLTRSTSNALQQAATREGLQYDAWFGVDPRLLTSLVRGRGGEVNQLVSSLANLRGVSFGIYLRDQIRLEVAMDTPSPEIADRMITAYNQKQLGSNNILGGQTWLTAEGARLRFIEIVDGRALKDIPGLDAGVAQMIGPQMGPLIQSLANINTASAAEPAKPSSPGAIVINGLSSK